MQSIDWYRHRLQMMTGGELAWRLRGLLRGLAERPMRSFRTGTVDIKKIAHCDGAAREEPFDLSLLPGRFEEIRLGSLSDGWRIRAVESANDHLENRWTFFDFAREPLGAEIDWNYEYESKRAAPMTFSSGIDYRDHTVTGDAKIVWQPNRHHHLVVLARAYRMTGDRRYAEKVVEQIESWIRQCPFGRGMNWRSPLELAIRLINWVWALSLIAPSQAVTSDHVTRLLPVVYRHLWEIRRNYSRFSSANNHLIGEAAGVFIGCTFFRMFKGIDAWRDEAALILSKEINRQTLDDGGNCELSSSYHLFVLEFFLLAGVVARRSGSDFDSSYWRLLEDMFDYLAALQEGGDHLPMLGDADDGYVLDLEAPETRSRSLLSVGAKLFGRADWETLSQGHGERVYWMFGDEPSYASTFSGNEGFDRDLQSRAFKSSGYYLLQAGRVAGNDRVSVTFDCGSLGFGSIAAHGHADALSFTLRAFGADVIVDPGTYDYFTFPALRDHFRSTRAHNTIVVDGVDQSEMLGAFMWGERATSRCLEWRPMTAGGTVSGEHNGYSRLSDAVLHRRTMTLNANPKTVELRDELISRGRHGAELCLHFAEQCSVKQAETHRVIVNFGRGMLDIELDPRLQVRLARGESDPPAGWVSRGYHRKVPATSLFATCTWSGCLELQTRMTLSMIETDPGGVPALTTTP